MPVNGQSLTWYRLFNKLAHGPWRSCVIMHSWALPFQLIWLTETDYIWCRHQMEHFPRYWPFVRGIRRWLVKSPHKGQWRGALMVSLICAWINAGVNNREAGDSRRHRAHYDVILMIRDKIISGRFTFWRLILEMKNISYLVQPMERNVYYLYYS